MWVCSACGIPRYWKETHAIKPCSKCGAVLPSHHVFIDRDSKEYTKHSRNAGKITAEARRLLTPLGVSIPEALIDISYNGSRVPRGPKDGWFTTIYLGEDKLQGMVPYDFIQYYTPRIVRQYVAKTKMVQMRLPVELHKWLKKFSQQQETTMTKIIISHIQALQNKHRKTIEVEQI